jgi:GH43 family beta-xylosidase
VITRTDNKQGTTRWRFLSVVAVLAALLAPTALMLALSVESAASTDEWLPVINEDFADPAIMVNNGTYYAYSTQVYLDSVPEFNTTNVNEWNNNLGDAMPNLASWVQFGGNWAPTVEQNASGQFVMFYSAIDKADQTHCLGEAYSSSPTGPFVDSNAAPVVCQNTLGGDIDPDIFQDTNGQSYLLWKVDGDSIGQPSTLWSQPLDSNFNLTGAPTQILQADESWQNGIIEGPDMVNVSGHYLLFYSGNAYETANYAIGVAVCTSPVGPCTDSTANPVLSSQQGMEGPGGPSLFTSPSGTLMMAFAAWTNGLVGYATQGAYRGMYLASVTFSPSSGALEFTPVSPPLPTAPSPVANPQEQGYWEVANDGGIFSYGSASYYGSTGSNRPRTPVVDMAATADGHGYWFTTAAGQVFNYGDAGFYGSVNALTLPGKIVGIAATPDDRGYWLVGSDGSIYPFGDAVNYGSMHGQALRAPIVGMTVDSATGGYWLVGSDGGVFAFNAPFFGSTGNLNLVRPVVGMAATPDGKGYWFVASDGGIFSYGDANYYGSMGGKPLNEPIVGMSPTLDGAGYRLVASDGGVFSFGDARFYGSMGGQPLNAPIATIGTAS